MSPTTKLNFFVRKFLIDYSEAMIILKLLAELYLRRLFCVSLVRDMSDSIRKKASAFELFCGTRYFAMLSMTGEGMLSVTGKGVLSATGKAMLSMAGKAIQKKLRRVAGAVTETIVLKASRGTSVAVGRTGRQSRLSLPL